MKECRVPKMYTINKGAELSGVSYYSLRKMIIEGKLPALKLDGKYMISEENLCKVLNGEN